MKAANLTDHEAAFLALIGRYGHHIFDRPMTSTGPLLESAADITRDLMRELETVSADLEEGMLPITSSTLLDASVFAHTGVQIVGEPESAEAALTLAVAAYGMCRLFIDALVEEGYPQ